MRKELQISHPFLKEIISAAINKNIVLIQYNSPKSKPDKKIVPIGVYAYNGKWYSPALDIELMEYRLYRVDRIIDFKNSMDTYENLMSLKEWLSNYPINNPIELHVKLNRIAYLECKDIYFLQNDLEYIDNNCYTLKKTIGSNEIPFYTKLLLRLGTNAKVIEPSELINSLKREIMCMYILYDIKSK
jgi:predicted DNA-binding transcriptional regulator YafY